MRHLLIEPALLRNSAPRAAASGAGAGWTRTGGADELSPRAFLDLLRAISALRHPAALSVLFGCVLAGVLLGGFLSTLGGHSGLFLSVLGALSSFIATATGLNAAGVLLMAKARQAPPRDLQAAVTRGLMCVPKCAVLGATLLLIAFVVMLGLTATYFVCRVPLVGPLLFVAVFPLSVVIGGVAFSGLSLCLFLSLPAIWDGASLATAIAQSLAIARARLVEAFLMMAVVGGLTLLVGGVVFGALFAGLMPMLTLAANIFGADAVSSLPGMLLPDSGEAVYRATAGGGGDHAIAIAIGGGMLATLAGSLVMLVPLLGLALVYLRLNEGIAPVRPGLPFFDTGAARTSKQPAAVMAAADRRLATLSEPVARQAPQVRDDDFTVPRALRRNRCSHCLSSVEADDVFCEICGYKLG